MIYLTINLNEFETEQKQAGLFCYRNQRKLTDQKLSVNEKKIRKGRVGLGLSTPQPHRGRVRLQPVRGGIRPEDLSLG